ncbi:hypothetical protein DITRI_Ditri18aG0069700 [Diplodiscus trichospermus]
MLQRAASNAYSWWWASHIRTKQSKWLEQNLQDMEEKVAIVLKLIEEDGDSFAKRAEMYYKKRPELIHFVEESYRAYRALAERYDHISTELQNANNTIASVFPDQVQFAMDDEDEFGSPRFSKKSSQNSKGNIPKVPKLPVKDLRGLATSATKNMQNKKSTRATTNAVPKSGLMKAEGLEEIDRLQKRILALQTEKEFFKSSYEGVLARYWEIDNEIKEMQEKICILQDEFGEGRVIEDDEARNVMAATALKSCKETLDQLQEKQERSVMEAELERKRIKDARQKLDSLKNKFLLNQASLEKPSAGAETGVAVEKSKSFEQDGSDTNQKRKDIESLTEKIKEHFAVSLGETLTVTEMAEKIDELVNKVISLETAVSSQTALIQRLRTETDELQAHIRTLEDDKATLVNGKNDLINKLSEMEEKLRGIQDLNQSVEDQNNNLQIHFTEAHCNLDHLSEKVHTLKPDEELERDKSSPEEVKSSMEIKDRDRKPKKVKADNELEVADASEKEKSANEVKSQKESEEQQRRNMDPTDGSKNMQSSIPKEVVVVSGSSQKGDDSLVKVEPPKESEEQLRGNMDPNDGSQNLQSAKPEEKVVVSSSLQKGDDSLVNIEPPKESEEQQRRNMDPSDGSEILPSAKPEEMIVVSGPLQNGEDYLVKVEPPIESEEQQRRNMDPSGGSKKLQSEKPEEMVVVSGSSQKGEDSSVKLEPPKESEEKGEKLDHNDGFAKNGDVKLGRREDWKEHVSVTTSSNGGFSHETSNSSEKCQDVIAEDKVDKEASSGTEESLANVESREEERGEDGEPNWKQLFMKGMEDREKNLLKEYTAMLRNYKDTRKKVMELETNNHNGLFEITLQLKEMKSTNAMKDEEIRSLRQKLSLFQTGLGENNNTDQYVEPRVVSEKSTVTETSEAPTEKEVKEDIGVELINQPQTISEIEEKFRMSIDELLEENLDFWFRFSTVFHEVQKFETGVKDLEAEVSKLEERKKQGGSSTSKYSLKSDVRPLYKHLREVQNELNVWVEKSVLLKEELKNRFSSLCNIQEEITDALKASAEDDDFKFTSYQAAKFQGEILNMKQENNKVADELQAGLDAVTTLQLVVERALAKLTEDWGLSGSRSRQGSPLQRSESRSGVPLRSFIFGVKPKKQKTSIFSCVHPALHRKYNARPGPSSSR